MFVRTLTTSNPSIKLISPNVDRDAKLGVTWLAGDPGHQSLKLMGVPDKHNKPTNLEAEQQRVSDFLEKDDQYNWMIELDGQVVGSVWIDRKPSDYLPAPSISIMIGNPSARGRQVGTFAFHAILDFLASEGHPKAYARHLCENSTSEHILKKLGFKPDGKEYTDNDGLHWQNTFSELAS